MVKILRRMCIGLGWLGALHCAVPVSPAATAGPTARPGSASASDRTPDQRYADARKRAEQLAREAYAKDPGLKQAEDALRDLERQEQQDTPRRALVAKFLKAEKAKNPNVADEYDRLRGQWLVREQVASVSDPAKAELLKGYLLRDAREVAALAKTLQQSFPELAGANLADREAVWAAYREKSPALLAENDRYFGARAKQSGFPDFVVEQAKREGERTLLGRLYGTYVAAHTPADLLNARNEAAALGATARAARVRRSAAP